MSELGEITRCWTIRFDRQSKHPVEKLWNAITDPERVSAWMGYPARIDLRPGGDWFVDFGDQGELDGVIVRVEPLRRLRCAWGRSVIEWELEPGDGGCSYRFLHHGQEPGTTPTEEGLAAGWHAFIDALAAQLDGKPFGREDDQAVIDEWLPAYRERLRVVLA